MVGKKSHRLIGQFLGDLHQKMSAAACRIQHREIEQVSGGLLRVGIDLPAYLFKVVFECGPHSVAHQVFNQRGRGVVNTPRLPASLIGQPQQVSGGNPGLVPVRVLFDGLDGSRRLTLVG